MRLIVTSVLVLLMGTVLGQADEKSAPPPASPPAAVQEAGGPASPPKPAGPMAELKLEPVSYKRQIEPIFAEACVGCHNAGDPQAKLNMESVALLQKGGQTGPSWEAGSRGKADDSLLMKYLDGRISPHMPKGKKKLSDKKIALIKRWIDEGALDDSEPKPTRLPRYTGPHVEPTRPAPVTALLWDRKNRFIAVAGYREIRLLDPQTGQEMGQLFDVTRTVHVLRQDAEGRILVAGGGVPGRLGEVTIYDAETRRTQRFLEDTRDSVYALAVRPDGQRIATGGPDKSLRIYDAKTGELLRKIDDHADWILGLDYSADGTALASAGRDKTIKLWDADQGERTQSATNINGPAYAVAWLPNGKSLLAACGDRQVRLVNAADGKSTKGFGGGGEMLCLAVARDGRTFAAGGSDGVVHVYNLDGKLLRALTGHGDWVYSVALSPDGSKLASGDFQGRVRIWNLQDGKLLAMFPSDPTVPPAAN